DRVLFPSFDARKPRGRRRLLAAQHVNCAGQLCELEFERADLPQLLFQLRLDPIQQLVARLPERPIEALDEVLALDVEMAPEPAVPAGLVFLINGWRGRCHWLRNRLRTSQRALVGTIFRRRDIPLGLPLAFGPKPIVLAAHFVDVGLSLVEIHRRLPITHRFNRRTEIAVLFVTTVIAEARCRPFILPSGVAHGGAGQGAQARQYDPMQAGRQGATVTPSPLGISRRRAGARIPGRGGGFWTGSTP